MPNADEKIHVNLKVDRGEVKSVPALTPKSGSLSMPPKKVSEDIHC